MSNSNIIAGAKMYTSAIKIMPYAHSRYMRALGNNDNFRFSLFGGTTEVREITGETAGTYDPATGFHFSNTADGGWTSHLAEMDRELNLSADALSEMDNIIAGMSLTIVEKAKASWRRLGPEIDAFCASKVSAMVPAENQLTGTDWALTADTIIDVLNKMDLKFTEAGYDDKVFVMISTSVAGLLREALKKNNGLASMVMLTQAPTTSDFDEKTIQYTSKVTLFGSRMYLYEVPATSMGNKIVVLDKKSAGQEAGGYKLDTTDLAYHAIKMQFIAEPSAALSVRHLVSNMTVPQRFADLDGFDLSSELQGINEVYEGVAVLQNIGIDQQGDQIRVMNRIKYGPAFFETQKHLIYEVY